jgi:hypothetical protein
MFFYILIILLYFIVFTFVINELPHKYNILIEVPENVPINRRNPSSNAYYLKRGYDGVNDNENKDIKTEKNIVITTNK